MINDVEIIELKANNLLMYILDDSSIDRYHSAGDLASTFQYERNIHALIDNLFQRGLIVDSAGQLFPTEAGAKLVKEIWYNMWISSFLH